MLFQNHGIKRLMITQILDQYITSIRKQMKGFRFVLPGTRIVKIKNKAVKKCSATVRKTNRENKSCSTKKTLVLKQKIRGMCHINFSLFLKSPQRKGN
jgi:hypothetical protein